RTMFRPESEDSPDARRLRGQGVVFWIGGHHAPRPYGGFCTDHAERLKGRPALTSREQRIPWALAIPLACRHGEARRAAGAGSGAGWPITSLSRVVLRDELVHEDGAVVTDDFTLEAAVGVLVDDAAAATGVVQVVAQPAAFVLFLIVLSVHDLPTRGPAPRG